REAESVAEAAVHGVLEVRVGVDEARHDRGVLEPLALAQLGRGADGGDAPVLDRHRAVLDRRSLDRQHPVRGQDAGHGSLMPAASESGAGRRRSSSMASTIEIPYSAISGSISSVVVTGSTPGSATAITAISARPMRQCLRS